MSDSFDYIVIGSGSAGSLMANRLSADPANRVTLIEAGPSDKQWPVNLKTAMPVGNIFLLPHAKYNWKQALTGNAAVNDRTINFPRGKLFGGCSAINGGVYIRGQRADYDAWADAGNDGWAYDDVLPAFKAVENYAGPDTPWHGKGGELDVQKPKSWNPVSAAIVDAAEQAGHRRNDDFASDRQDGFGRYDLNQRNGTRLSSARAFLHPVLDRANLTVMADTMVRRILFDRGRAVGLEIETGGARSTIAARREIILCAGATNSPQLLMLSGIGPQDHLREMGIDLVHHLPGVGAHLQDHPTVHVAMENPSAESYAVSAKVLPRILASPFKYLLKREGMLASNVAEAGGFLCTDGTGRPDIQITFLAGLKLDARSVPRRHGYMGLIQLLRPKSSGSVRLASNRPEDKPVIDPNFFADPYDMQTLIAGFRACRHIFAQPALAAMTGAEIEPGAQHQSDAEIDAALRKIVNTAYHPTGTCKMGPDSDPMAVVDNRLRVRGVSGLRVVDASVMPDIISGNTSAPTMMIAQRAAQFILQDAVTSNIAA
ncbi:MAG: glucose-methanol-choline oxidoreductase [Sphingobium sp.]|uniref:GMC family oxidoreductase n=1 Tax=Sphingobium sp. TaxID=1912891 RepID=UPI0008D3E290|nr:GMC family oxidoreductase N-terminal domain-containing protein [Sphingobium sp.]MBA4756398.1 GMC family oxidoreductase N-terminal domain-containing protein [Sphingobium sp.]OHC93858.1 MAG: glucose-methanol-choline oxidoreductase [Sphingomonadales bacterium GWF1_63_6]TAJ76685.1 MAG: glucose-methanol-choline oxidoreductase [Sphingobium sp.]